jgi:hypothetical protein
VSKRRPRVGGRRHAEVVRAGELVPVLWKIDQVVPVRADRVSRQRPAKRDRATVGAERERGRDERDRERGGEAVQVRQCEPERRAGGADRRRQAAVRDEHGGDWVPAIARPHQPHVAERQAPELGDLAPDGQDVLHLLVLRPAVADPGEARL